MNKQEFNDLKPGDKIRKFYNGKFHGVTLTLEKWIVDGVALFSYAHLPGTPRRYAKGGVIFDRGEHATMTIRNRSAILYKKL